MEQIALRDLVAELLEIDAVDLDGVLLDLGWDSLASLAFIAEVDERTGLQVSTESLADAVTVGDLFTLVNQI